MDNIRVGSVQQKIEAQNQREVICVHASTCTAPVHTIGLVLKEQIVVCGVWSLTGISLSSSQDMLYLLKKNGLTTTGVFLEPPSTTLCQTVKDKLDSEEEVDINKQSVNVVAWIFKVGNVLPLSTSGFLWVYESSCLLFPFPWVTVDMYERNLISSKSPLLVLITWMMFCSEIV